MRRYEHGGDVYSRDVALDFSVNTNPLGMPKAVLAALFEHADALSRYPDASCRALRDALAAHHGIAKENILCGNGAADMIFRACAYLKPKRVLTLAPSFLEYERPAKLFGAEVSEHRLCAQNGFLLTERILSDITPDTDAVFICNPNNPTGRVTDAALMLEIIERCREVNAKVIVDECFIGFTHSESVIRHIGEYKNLLVLRAFTKLYSMAGLRLGYLVGDEQLLHDIAQYGAEWSVSTPAQTAGVAALELEPEWTLSTRAYVDAERVRVSEALTALGLDVTPSEANFLLIKSPVPLYAPLLEARILVRDCSNFTGLDKSYIRIGLKTPQKNDALIEAVERAVKGK